MKILIIGSCTNKKVYTNQILHENKLKSRNLKEIKQKFPNMAYIQANKMYQGQQHLLILEAMRLLRKYCEVDYYVISAGFGLISEFEKIPSYNMTFQGKSLDYIKERGKILNIPDKFNQILKDLSWDFIFFALGREYLISLNISDDLEKKIYWNNPIKVFLTNFKGVTKIKNAISINMNSQYSARLKELKLRSTGVVSLKGLFFLNFVKIILKKKALDVELISQIKKNPEILEKIMKPENLKNKLSLGQKKLF